MRISQLIQRSNLVFSLYHCEDKLIDDSTEREKADNQLIAIRNNEELFRLQQTKYIAAKCYLWTF